MRAHTGVARRPAGTPGVRLFERRTSASGHRLSAAFEELERLPALADSRHELLRLLSDERSSLEDVALTIETDAALTVAVLRRAGLAEAARPIHTSVPHAVSVLTRDELRETVERVPVFTFFDRSHALAAEAARMRMHAVLTQQAAQRIAEEARTPVNHTLPAAALLHDIGKIVLVRAYDRYDTVTEVYASPERRLQSERRALGIDHASVGGVLLRRLGLTDELAAVVEHHHDPDATGDAARVRLADMLAHYAAGRPIEHRALPRAAEAAGLGELALRRLLAKPTQAGTTRRPSLDPCPLTRKQLDVLGGLRDGRSYKEIAEEHRISVSTVRSHLHHAYAAIGVHDRAQAVLRATQRGWI